ncbi:MAG: glycoside hydrolase family 43 protein [Prolixibacteraceae bacterium]
MFKLNLFKLSIAFFVLIVLSENLMAQIKPGEVWNDTEGNPINAHGGGVLFHDGTYYWYGEIKKGATRRVDYITAWECYRVEAGGVSCYSSTDLINWTNEGLALSPNYEDSTSDIHPSKVIERPKVIYNDKTGKYVMWMHIESEDYSYAQAGVAVSDSPQGPFTYLGSMRPNNQMSRDMTLFKDDDGKAYHIYSSEFNATMYISLLSEDYLKPSGTFTRNFIDESREAPAIIKYNNKYFIISSGCTGWSPNPAIYATADSILGPWVVAGDPCVNDKKQTTFDSQSTFIIPLKDKPGNFIFMADRWNKKNLEDSRYVWLPMQINDNKVQIEWKDSWNITNKK